jgi:hypothetical protein
MSLEAWGDDGDADRGYTQERVDEIVAEECADLAMMIRRLVRALKVAGVAAAPCEQALALLERKGLSGNPLRDGTL